MGGGRGEEVFKSTEGASPHDTTPPPPRPPPLSGDEKKKQKNKKQKKNEKTTNENEKNKVKKSGGHLRIMAWLSLPVFAALAIAHIESMIQPNGFMVRAQEVPAQAQVIDQKTFNVLPNVLPSTEVNGSQVFNPPNITPEDLMARPFHIYDDEFYSIIGTEPTLTLLAETESDPLFHEAVVW